MTELQRWSIVALHNDGRSLRYIAKHLDVSRDGASAVLHRFLATGSPGSGSRIGRPPAVDEELKLAIAVTARVEPFTSPKKIVRKLELDVSPRTVDRILQEAGLPGRVARHKRDYSPAEIQKRLSFAEGYKAWTAKQWERVIFSDEKTFYGEGWCGQVWVRRPIGEALNPDYTVHTVAHPVKIGMWGCFSVAGPGYIHLYNENMDAAMQKNILDENLVATAKDHKLLDGQWYFLHDNAPTFKANVVQKWLHDNGITCVEHPPYSPDLNPIENLWAWFAARVDKHNADSFEKLQDVLADEWEKMREDPGALEYMKTLVHSMPRRCQAVIDASGWHTKY